jgi:SHS2 domain-containing protein
MSPWNPKPAKRVGKLKFKFLEHKADAYIAAYGRTLEEAFENAALATFEVMTDTEKVEVKTKDLISVDGFDEKALLYNWLETLLVRFELKQTLYKKFMINRIEEHPSGFKLKATIIGEKFDPKKHPQKVGVKAITYHQMEILKEPDEVVVKFILDI